MAALWKGRPRTKPPGPASLECLQQVKEARKREHLHAKGTDNAYKGHVKRGKEFLSKLVADVRDSRAAGAELEAADDGGHRQLDVGQLEVAFEDPPNRLSPVALELFLTQKCLMENLGKDTANGIHAAFICHWDHMYV
jgi:hypothetical protein